MQSKPQYDDEDMPAACASSLAAVSKGARAVARISYPDQSLSLARNRDGEWGHSGGTHPA